MDETLEMYVQNIKMMMESMGHLPPSITVFGKHKQELIENTTEPKDAVIHVMIPSEFMESGETKQTFVDEVIPKIAKKMNEIISVESVGWASEVWVRTADPKDNVTEDNWDHLPIQQEAVFITIDTGDKTSSFCYDIHRKGKKITEEGEMVDDVELTINEKLSNKGTDTNDVKGRFGGLFQKFAQLGEES